MEELCKSSIFFSDQSLCYADILSPPEVRARIEVAVLNFLKVLNAPTPEISDLPLISRKSSNSRVSRGLLTDVSWIFLSQSFCKRSLMRENTAKSFVRDTASGEKSDSERVILQVALRFTRLFPFSIAGQRDHPRFSGIASMQSFQPWDYGIWQRSGCWPPIAAGAKQGSSGLLYLWIFWLCYFRGPEFVREIDHEDGCSLYNCSGEVFQHAIFQRLAEDCVFNQIPSILITAKGYPDIATRFFLHRMSRAFPEMPILGLVDWNPAGLAILCTYKFGSIGMGLEAYRYACNVKWLGMRMDDISQLVPEESLINLKPKDLQIAKSLLSSDVLQDSYKEELATMVESGRRAEIEALYFHGYEFLGKYLATKIVQANYI
nr:meiotic recombination protein SPO11-2 isoform X2 [Coffea arabica]